MYIERCLALFGPGPRRPVYTEEPSGDPPPTKYTTLILSSRKPWLVGMQMHLSMFTVMDYSNSPETHTHTHNSTL